MFLSTAITNLCELLGLPPENVILSDGVGEFKASEALTNICDNPERDYYINENGIFIRANDKLQQYYMVVSCLINSEEETPSLLNTGKKIATAFLI